MADIKTDLKELLQGEIDDSDESRELFSHDASMFEMKPEFIV